MLAKLEEKSFVSDLTYSDTQNNTLASTLAMIDSFCMYLPGYVTSVAQHLTAIQNVISKIEKEEGTVTVNNSISLVEAGIELLSGTGICPLCLTQWATEDELKTFLLDRKRKGEILSTLLDDFTSETTKLDLEVQKYKGLLSSTIAQVQKISDANTDVSSLQAAKDNLSVFAEIKTVTVDSFSQKEKEIEQYQKDYPLEDYSKQLNEISARIKPLIDSQSQSRAEALAKIEQFYEPLCWYMQVLCIKQHQKKLMSCLLHMKRPKKSSSTYFFNQ